HAETALGTGRMTSTFECSKKWGDYRTTTTADRTIATPRVFYSVRQAQFNNNPATMANYSVDRTDLNVPDSFEICHFSVNPNAWLRDWTHSALTAHLESFVKLQ
ncbi:hypothetical protein, partial [Aeromonas sp. QDB20]|uniref:hypothetical protein n=1 Tax=Aeromonas sp. QDB20 TaxID=2989835 RepID=UPI003FA465A9